MRLLIVLVVGLMFAGATWFLVRRSPAPPATPVSAPAAVPASKPLEVKPWTPEPTYNTPALKKSGPAPAVPTSPAAPASEASPATGTVTITADVPEASVFLDREFIGPAPATKAGVAPGRHRLNVSAPGYDAVSEDIDVAAGTREIAVSLTDVRLSASIAVTHKHGMGSCKGTLKASPQGVVYEADTKGDAFSVAMADIETFEVDYLAKNLKLKVRKGKTYNFTDPDGNADRLFVFHRDVDKARARIIAK